MEKTIEEINAKTDLAKITITSVPDEVGAASELFSLIGEAGFNIETITQLSTKKHYCDIAFTIKEAEVEQVLEYLLQKRAGFKVSDAIIDKNVALITIFGKKIATTPGIAGKIFATVSKKGINIENITAGLMMITFLVPKDRANEVIQSLKQEFA